MNSTFFYHIVDPNGETFLLRPSLANLVFTEVKEVKRATYILLRLNKTQEGFAIDLSTRTLFGLTCHHVLMQQ